MKKWIGSVMMMVVMFMAGTASAVEIEKLLLDVNTRTVNAFDTDNLTLNGRLKLSLVESTATGAAIGLDLQPAYTIGSNSFATQVGVYARPFDAVEAYVTKAVDVDHFGDNMNADNVTAGVRFKLVGGW